MVQPLPKVLKAIHDELTRPCHSFEKEYGFALFFRNAVDHSGINLHGKSNQELVMHLQSFLANLRNSQTAGQGWTPKPATRDIWPSDYLRDFAERMAMNGMAVSGVRLRNDPVYTLNQLAMAHATDDETLRDMAMSLFRQFEGKQSGISCPAGE